MKFLSLFSGIEAASVAWHPLGWECAGVSEIEPFPCALLAHHYPNVPNLGDVTKITEQDIAALGRIDIVVFGSPCQDMSIAGKRKGLLNADGTVTRSGLFFNAFNIFQWARKHCGARFALWENVAGAYSSNQGQDFASVVSFMAGLDDLDVPANGWGAEGCALGDNGMLEWACLDAQWFGVAQRRRRVFAVLDTGDWANRPPILLERQSLRGDIAPRRETGQGVTHDIAPCLTSSRLQRIGDATGQDAVVATYCLAHGQGGAELGIDRSPTLTCNHEAPIAAYSVALRGRDGGATAELGGDVAGTLRASGGGGDKAHVLAFDSRQDCVSSSHVFGALGSSSPQAQAVCITGDITHTLKAEGFDGSEDGTGRGNPIVSVLMPDTLYNKGFTQGAINASPQETDARDLLRTLREEIGEKTFAEWGFGVLDSLHQTEVLRSALHGSGIRPAALSGSWVVGGPLPLAQHGSRWLLQSLLEAGCERCASQGWQPSEQLTRELGAHLSQLPQPGAQAARFLCDLRDASEGFGILRNALSTIQKVGRPVDGQGQPVHGDTQGIGIQPGENVQGVGLRPELSLEGLLLQACAAGQAGNTGHVEREQGRCNGKSMGNQTYAVRRLLPVECARLQGFPDNYLSSVIRNGKPPADGPMYKALGNSMAVPCMRWIGERIQMVSEIQNCK